ncbi:MAG TPA: hemerythrin domain-containing protein [Polyangiaceae bacterium]
MKLLDALEAEHAVIERVLGSFVTFAARCAEGTAKASDAHDYLAFFRLFAGRYHHAREDGILFPALVETGVPGDRGPIAILLADHRAMEKLQADLTPLAARLGSADDARALEVLVKRYATMLLHHIDAETSVLFPESASRFRAASVTELPNRAPDDEEAAARDHAERLVLAYPPSDVPGIDRGDGCCACPAYGNPCEGIEREWWSELEWEDSRERLSSQ